MKITKKILENLIKEEIEKMQIDENDLENRQMDAMASKPSSMNKLFNDAYQDRRAIRARIEKIEDLLMEKLQLPRGTFDLY